MHQVNALYRQTMAMHHLQDCVGEIVETRVDAARVLAACALLCAGSTQEAITVCFEALLWRAGKLQTTGAE